MRTTAGLSALCSLVMALLGCGAPPQTHLACAPAWVINGSKRALTPAEFRLVEPKLSAYLEQRGLTLVSDAEAADYVVTIRYVPDAAKSEIGSLDVLDLSVN